MEPMGSCGLAAELPLLQKLRGLLWKTRRGQAPDIPHPGPPFRMCRALGSRGLGVQSLGV